MTEVGQEWDRKLAVRMRVGKGKGRDERRLEGLRTEKDGGVRIWGREIQPLCTMEDTHTHTGW